MSIKKKKEAEKQNTGIFYKNNSNYKIEVILWFFVIENISITL